MTPRLLALALLAGVAAGCSKDDADTGATSTELSRAEVDQQRTAAQADADVRAAEAAADSARRQQSIGTRAE